MLPEGYKRLILGFVQAVVVNGGGHEEEKEFDDVIRGKGRGLIMLLEGTPGTGKTLTAEAVADQVRRPLYYLSAGELGQDADRVEDRLTRVFDLAARWNAVLLFDECDVFLQERSTEQLARNEIVAIFLRYVFATK